MTTLQYIHTQQKKKELILLAKQTGYMHILNYMFYKIINFGIELNKPFETKDEVIEQMHKTLTQIIPNTKENVLKHFETIMNNWKEYKNYHVTN